MNLTEIAGRDLAVTLENPSGWGVPVVITRKSDSFTQSLYGQVLRDSVSLDADGAPIIDHAPVVSLNEATLTNVPADGETWYFDIPFPITQSVITKRYVFDGDDARRGFNTIGVYTYPLKEYEDERTP